MLTFTDILALSVSLSLSLSLSLSRFLDLAVRSVMSEVHVLHTSPLQLHSLQDFYMYMYIQVYILHMCFLLETAPHVNF